LEWKSLLSRGAPVVRLNNGLLKELLGQLWEDEQRFYLCGPPGFMRMAVFTLRLMGVADQQIRRENFTVEYVPPPPLLLDKSPRQVVVRAEGTEMRFTTAWPSTILQSALDQHIALPYSCKGGRCSTCVARCVSGKVQMSINEVLTAEDLQAGLVLTCVGYAETDVALEFGAGGQE
jgi:ring-1,2-phenylacetyl-CoA epoxidase subunit PaaE